MLVTLDNGFLDVLVHGGLDGSHESRTHVGAASTEQQSRSQAVAIGETTAGNEGNLEGLTSPTQQDEVGDVALANVAGALEAVDGEEIDAELDGALGVADGGTLVEDDDAGFLELLDHRAGGVACRLDDLDALVNNGLGVRAVVGRNHGGEKGDVDGEGLLGETAAAADFVAESSGRGEDEGRDDSQTAGVGDG